MGKTFFPGSEVTFDKLQPTLYYYSGATPQGLVTFFTDSRFALGRASL